MSVLDVAVQETAAAGRRSCADFINPQWARLLQLLEMDADYVECRGEPLRTSDGRQVLDFLSGYCVCNAGHHHPAIVEARHRDLDRSGPSMLQSHVTYSENSLAMRAGLAMLDVLDRENLPERALATDPRHGLLYRPLVHSSTRFWQDALTLAARAART